MKKNLYFVNLLLVAEVGLLCLFYILMNTFMPAAVLPRIDIPFLVLLSVIPMMIKYCTAPEAKGNLWISMIMAGLTFAILPMCANMNMTIPMWKLFVAGTAVFGITAVVYGSIGRRIASGSYGRFAPIVNGLMLYLASQCLQGLL